MQAKTPDLASLSRTRRRIDLGTHRAIFDLVLKRLTEHDLLKGNTLGVDALVVQAWLVIAGPKVGFQTPVLNRLAIAWIMSTLFDVPM